MAAQHTQTDVVSGALPGQEQPVSAHRAESGATGFDTSGVVDCPVGKLISFRPWSDLSPFAQGYVEALFKSFHAEVENIRSVLSRANVIGTNEHLVRLQAWGALGFSDLSPEALGMILADCEALQRNAWPKADLRRLGQDCWRSRQEGRSADFPPLTVSLNDDGKIVLAVAS